MVRQYHDASSFNRLPGLHRRHRPDRLIAQPVYEPALPDDCGELFEEAASPRSILIDALALTVLVATPMVLAFTVAELIWSLSFM